VPRKKAFKNMCGIKQCPCGRISISILGQLQVLLDKFLERRPILFFNFLPLPLTIHTKEDAAHVAGQSNKDLF
jgi:hypothetical protein